MTFKLTTNFENEVAKIVYFVADDNKVIHAY